MLYFLLHNETTERQIRPRDPTELFPSSYLTTSSLWSHQVPELVGVTDHVHRVRHVWKLN
ncbi:hypothetical protein N7447_011088 [Penicillium robsamsonii]|uniref:uncharacterized protein n=1 Tax=Penicillium robsamsonii TaxID=1792511 RepID=UPI002548538B|nr:uncharacterized protein N7447_011088 [Penicillium robsamsonii]KAJ5807632.1 hypothetical protein N7447_011088 [Penicillium robsamsonii]